MKTRNCNRHTCIVNQCSNVDQKPDRYKDMHDHYTVCLQQQLAFLSALEFVLVLQHCVTAASWSCIFQTAPFCQLGLCDTILISK